jgi:hypothetical protein
VGLSGMPGVLYSLICLTDLCLLWGIRSRMLAHVDATHISDADRVLLLLKAAVVLYFPTLSFPFLTAMAYYLHLRNMRADAGHPEWGTLRPHTWHHRHASPPRASPVRASPPRSSSRSTLSRLSPAGRGQRTSPSTPSPTPITSSPGRAAVRRISYSG